MMQAILKRGEQSYKCGFFFTELFLVVLFVLNFSIYILNTTVSGLNESLYVTMQSRKLAIKIKH